MNGSAPECPSCRISMEHGHVLTGESYRKRERVKWVEGEPEKSALFGYQARGKRQLPAVTWRCPRCGWLLWFAPDVKGQ